MGKERVVSVRLSREDFDRLDSMARFSGSRRGKVIRLGLTMMADKLEGQGWVQPRPKAEEKARAGHG